MLTGCVGTEAGTALTTRIRHQSLPTPGRTSKFSSPQAASPAPRCLKPSMPPGPGQTDGSSRVTRRRQGNAIGSADLIPLPPSALRDVKTQKSSWSSLERMVLLVLYSPYQQKAGKPSRLLLLSSSTGEE